MDKCPVLDKGPVEEVSIVRHEDVWPQIPHVVEEAANKGPLVSFIEDNEGPGVLWLWGVLKVINILRHNLTIDDEKAFTVKHVRDHKDLIDLGVRKLQRRLRTLNVEREDARAGGLDPLLLALASDTQLLDGLDCIPASAAQVKINAAPREVENVILANVGNGLHQIIGDNVAVDCGVAPRYLRTA